MSTEQGNNNNAGAPRLMRANKGAYRRTADSSVTVHGKMPLATAETIYRQVLTAYLGPQSTTEMREELLETLAEALQSSTSDETVWTDVSFELSDGGVKDLGLLHSVVTQHYSGVNPIRTWVKSFREGELPCRISDLLADPTNVAIRQVAAYRYGTPVDNAHFCFDTADALLASGRVYSHSEMKLIEGLKIVATDRAAQNAGAQGEVRPVQDSTGRVGFKDTATPAPEIRSGFRTVR